MADAFDFPQLKDILNILTVQIKISTAHLVRPTVHRYLAKQVIKNEYLLSRHVIELLKVQIHKKYPGGNYEKQTTKYNSIDVLY